MRHDLNLITSSKEHGGAGDAKVLQQYTDIESYVWFVRYLNDSDYESIKDFIVKCFSIEQNKTLTFLENTFKYFSTAIECNEKTTKLLLQVQNLNFAMANSPEYFSLLISGMGQLNNLFNDEIKKTIEDLLKTNIDEKLHRAIAEPFMLSLCFNNRYDDASFEIAKNLYGAHKESEVIEACYLDLMSANPSTAHNLQKIIERYVSKQISEGKLVHPTRIIYNRLKHNDLNQYTAHLELLFDINVIKKTNADNFLYLILALRWFPFIDFESRALNDKNHSNTLFDSESYEKILTNSANSGFDSPFSEYIGDNTSSMYEELKSLLLKYVSPHNIKEFMENFNKTMDALKNYKFKTANYSVVDFVITSMSEKEIRFTPIGGRKIIAPKSENIMLCYEYLESLLSCDKISVECGIEIADSLILYMYDSRDPEILDKGLKIFDLLLSKVEDTEYLSTIFSQVVAYSTSFNRNTSHTYVDKIKTLTINNKIMVDSYALSLMNLIRYGKNVADSIHELFVLAESHQDDVKLAITLNAAFQLYVLSMHFCELDNTTIDEHAVACNSIIHKKMANHYLKQGPNQGQSVWVHLFSNATKTNLKKYGETGDLLSSATTSESIKIVETIYKILFIKKKELEPLLVRLDKLFAHQCTKKVTDPRLEIALNISYINIILQQLALITSEKDAINQISKINSIKSIYYKAMLFYSTVRVNQLTTLLPCENLEINDKIFLTIFNTYSEYRDDTIAEVFLNCSLLLLEEETCFSKQDNINKIIQRTTDILSVYHYNADIQYLSAAILHTILFDNLYHDIAVVLPLLNEVKKKCADNKKINEILVDITSFSQPKEGNVLDTKYEKNFDKIEDVEPKNRTYESTIEITPTKTETNKQKQQDYGFVPARMAERSEFLGEDQNSEFDRSIPIYLDKQNSESQSGVPILVEKYKEYNPSNVVVHVDGSDAHTLVLGVTGSKKSRTVLMPTVLMLARAGESFIVSDPKGEICRTTANIVNSYGYKVLVLSFRKPKSSNSWNPLDLPYSGSTFC